ncbi:hypothetical protein OY671_010884, partial [Metschnikowia pulcherrima]
MAGIGRRARAAARKMALATAQAKDVASRTIAECIRARGPEISRENARDVAAAKAAGHSQASIDRLTLDEKRLARIADAVEKSGARADPVGRQLAAIERPNGSSIERIAVPLGVIGVIFESRPNVAADAGVSCSKSGNAVISRGGSDSFRSCRAIHQCSVQGSREA